MTRALDATPSKTCPQCGGTFTAKEKGANFAEQKYCSAKCMGLSYRYSPEKRLEVFMSRVIKAESGCWLYQGARDQWGHAHIGINGRRQLAHRYFYATLKEPIPQGRLVLHRCNVAHCVNPEHLYLGDHKANTRDKLMAGRHNGAKLNPEKVREIRKLLGTMPQAEIARLYNVTDNTISHIALNQQWTFVE